MTEHSTRIEGEGDGWEAFCSCGWVGTMRADRGHAEDDATDHAPCFCGHGQASHTQQDGLDYCMGCAEDFEGHEVDYWHGFEEAR